MQANEMRFKEILNDLFVGEKVVGNSGFANLMRIKNAYYEIFAKDFSQKSTLFVKIKI
ncbi:MAG: hypothetical protein MR902_00790 [Campylobacter sp.]|nr:hypothetical protein [Campylobacter sp.]